MGCEGLEQKFPHKPKLDSIDLELQPILAIRSDIGNRNRCWMKWAKVSRFEDKRSLSFD